MPTHPMLSAWHSGIQLGSAIRRTVACPIRERHVREIANQPAGEPIGFCNGNDKLFVELSYQT